MLPRKAKVPISKLIVLVLLLVFVIYSRSCIKKNQINNKSKIEIKKYK